MAVYWSTHEKRQLSMLLEIYPLYAYKSIAKKLKTRSADEVKLFIDRLKQSVQLIERKKLGRGQQNKPKNKQESRAPLEDWLDICLKLVEKETFDTSTHLSKVMTVISHLEDFEQTEKHPPVNFSSIYRYLAQLLHEGNQHDEVECLEPLESAVLLDVIHSLMDVLSAGDLTIQRNVMQWKCTLLDDRDKNGQTLPESMKKAAENDFASFIEEEDKKMTEKLNMQKAKEEELNAKSKEDIRADAAGEMVAESKVTKLIDKERLAGLVLRKNIDEITTKDASYSKSNTSEQRSKDNDMITITTPAGKLCTYKRSWKHKPGRKRKHPLDEEAPLTDIVVVVPPKDVKIVNYTPRKKKPSMERTDGKYKSLEKEATDEIIGDERTLFGNKEDTPQARLSTLAKLHKKHLNMIENEQIDAKVRTQAMTELYEKHRKKYKQLQDAVDKSSSKSKKKPKLYTINPFCVPISLLNLSS